MPRANSSGSLLDAREELSLPTTNAAYAAVLAVFVTFRAQLTAEQALVFADALPAVVGAMLLREWQVEPTKPFGDRGTLTREAQRFRPDPTLLPDSGIADTARSAPPHRRGTAGTAPRYGSGSGWRNVMSTEKPPSPKRAGKAAIVIVSAVLLIVVAIFIGLNLQHAKTLREEQAGQVVPANSPKTEKDLGSSPIPRR